MDELLQLDETLFQEDESLHDRMERNRPKFDMTNSALKAICGYPPIPIHSESDETWPPETEMFNILVSLINVPNEDYSRATSASQAAHATNALFLSMTPDPSLRHTEKYSYGALWTVWSELFNFVKQIPVEHHAMQRLVDWIAELRGIEVQIMHIWGQDIDLWKELPLLYPEWVEWIPQYCVSPKDCRGSRFRTFRDLLETSDGYKLWNLWK
ncbi:hypothetical protein KCU93_g1111, partial [Aureobasidium melanogenum]